jgi:hypothetical protein
METGDFKTMTLAHFSLLILPNEGKLAADYTRIIRVIRG